MGKKRVAVLGATGIVGQKLVQLLSNHPWFEVSSGAASDKSVGKSYAQSTSLKGKQDLSEKIRNFVVGEATPRALDDPDIVFSALPTNVAASIEEDFARSGLPVFSSASSHRMDQYVPLLNPEVNADHASLLEEQRRRMKWDGFIATNPNCTTSILTLSLIPLYDKFGLDTVVVSSMQAISGAGYPGVASMDILENIIPFIRHEEEKVERETNKILGTATKPATITVTASCQRVQTIHGHIEAVLAKTKTQTSPEEAAKSMSEFQSTPQRMKLPSAPPHPVLVRKEEDRPQTRLDVDEGNGMTVSVGRLRRDSALNGIKYIVLGHNLVRGGAGCSILNAELLIAQKYIQ